MRNHAEPNDQPGMLMYSNSIVFWGLNVLGVGFHEPQGCLRHLDAETVPLRAASDAEDVGSQHRLEDQQQHGACGFVQRPLLMSTQNASLLEFIVDSCVKVVVTRRSTIPQRSHFPGVSSANSDPWYGLFRDMFTLGLGIEASERGTSLMHCSGADTPRRGLQGEGVVRRCYEAMSLTEEFAYEWLVGTKSAPKSYPPKGPQCKSTLI